MNHWTNEDYNLFIWEKKDDTQHAEDYVEQQWSLNHWSLNSNSVAFNFVVWIYNSASTSRPYILPGLSPWTPMETTFTGSPDLILHSVMKSQINTVSTYCETIISETVLPDWCLHYWELDSAVDADRSRVDFRYFPLGPRSCRRAGATIWVQLHTKTAILKSDCLPHRKPMNAA